jgi:hypothetical protein
MRKRRVSQKRNDKVPEKRNDADLWILNDIEDINFSSYRFLESWHHHKLHHVAVHEERWKFALYSLSSSWFAGKCYLHGTVDEERFSCLLRGRNDQLLARS